MRSSQLFCVSIKKALTRSTYCLIYLLCLFLDDAHARWTQTPAPEASPTADPNQSIIDLNNVSVELTRIDYNRITDPSYTIELLRKACPFFTEKEAQEYSRESFANYGRKELIPLPHNIKHQHLPKSRKVKAVISGAGPFLPERHKKVCLNHLAFTIARQIPYYRFFSPYEFKLMDNVYVHATKIPAIMATMNHIKEDDWVLWLDDDVLSSDFMQRPYDHSYVFVEGDEGPIREPLALTDRVIDKAFVLYNKELAEKSTEDKSTESDENATPILPPSVVAIEDSKEAVLNTGALLVRNDHNGKEVMRIWWFNVVREQFPVQKEFYCDRARTTFKTLDECLAACQIVQFRDGLNCGPDKELSKKMSSWNNDKERGNYLFDQDVLKGIYKWQDKPDNRRPRYINSIRLVKARQDFGLKNYSGKVVEESFNAFYRTYSVEGQVSAMDTLVDKWAHVTGMPEHEKNAYIRNWLTLIVNYPVRRLPDGTSTLLEKLDLERVSDGHDLPPTKTIPPSTQASHIEQDKSESVHIKQPLEGPEESESAMFWPLMAVYTVFTIAVGYTMRVIQTRIRWR